MKKIYLFGDSITAGYYEQEITDLLTKQVAANFLDFEVINAGIPGDTTTDALARIEAHVLKYHPDLVTVFFGANDAALHRILSRSQYEENLRNIIELLGPEKVILISPPYVSQRSRKMDRPLSRLEKFAEITQKVATDYNLIYLDLLTAMMADDNPESLFQDDGLHLSLYGYDRLGDLINQTITTKLEEMSEPKDV